MCMPAEVVVTALRHLESRKPGPSVIDGATNRVAASAVRLISTPQHGDLMHRMTNLAFNRRSTSPELSEFTK